MFERELRDLSYVPRWGIVRTLRPQSVSEHSYYVTMGANDIASFLGLPTDTQLRILKMALWHDVDELLTGDIPGPHKRKIIDKPKAKHFLSEAMDKIFSFRGHRDGSPNTADALAISVVKIADMMDAINFLHEEMSMGNGNVLHLTLGLWETVEECCEDIHKILQDEKSLKLYNKLRDSVTHAVLHQSRGPILA